MLEQAKDIAKALEEKLINSSLGDAEKGLAFAMKHDVGRSIAIEGVIELMRYIKENASHIHSLLDTLNDNILPAVKKQYDSREISKDAYLALLRRLNQLGNRMGHIARLIDEAHRLSKRNVQVHLRDSGYDLDVSALHTQQAKEAHQLFGRPGDRLASLCALLHNKLKSVHQEPLSWKGQKKKLADADVHPNGPKKHKVREGGYFYSSHWKKEQVYCEGSDTDKHVSTAIQTMARE